MLFLAEFSFTGPDPIPVILISGFLFLTVLLAIAALLDLFGRQFADPLDRTFWLLAIILTGPIGSIFYLSRRKYFPPPKEREKHPTESRG